MSDITYGSVCSGIMAATQACTRWACAPPGSPRSSRSSRRLLPNTNEDTTILAANVRADAVEGITTSMAAKNLGMHIKRVTLIAQENGFKFADNP